MSVLRLYRLATIIGTRRSPDDIDPVCQGWGKILGINPADRDEAADLARAVVPVAARVGDDDPTATRAAADLLKFVDSVTDQARPDDPTVPTPGPYLLDAVSTVYRLAVVVGAVYRLGVVAGTWHGPARIQLLCESWGWILGLDSDTIELVADCARSNSATGQGDDSDGQFDDRHMSPADVAAELCSVLVGIAELATTN